MNLKQTIYMKPLRIFLMLNLALLFSTTVNAQENNSIFTFKVIEEDNSISIQINTIDNNGPYYYVLRDKNYIQSNTGINTESTVLDYSKKTRSETYTFNNLTLDSYCVCVRNNSGQSICETIDINDYINPKSK